MLTTLTMQVGLDTVGIVLAAKTAKEGLSLLPQIQTLSVNADRVLIATNPRAGSGSRKDFVESFIDQSAERGWRIEILKDLDEITELANAWYEEGTLRALVAAGGDGTAAELVNRVKPEVPIVPLPLGTENLLARHLNIHKSANDVAWAVAHGKTIRLDAGKANGRLFLLMASCGLDAEIVRNAHRDRKGNISRWSYIKPIWESLRSYEYPDLKISYCTQIDPNAAEGTEQWQSTEARWAFVFNMPCYGLGLKVTAEAEPTDSLLDLCTFEKGSWMSSWGYFFQVGIGVHSKSKEFKTAKVTKVKIESDKPVPYQLDGDPGEELPLEIEIVPKRFTLIVPKEWAKSYE